MNADSVSFYTTKVACATMLGSIIPFNVINRRALVTIKPFSQKHFLGDVLKTSVETATDIRNLVAIPSGYLAAELQRNLSADDLHLP